MATGGEKDVERFSDETFEFLCSLCKSKNKTTEATKFCVDCQDYYCTMCVKFHNDIPALLRHKILNKGQFQQGPSKGPQMVPTERCDRHSHKHVDMYCQNHDDVGCTTCMAVHHKSCKDTFFIPDFIQNNPDTVNPQAIDRKLGSTLDLLNYQHSKFNQEKVRLLKYEALCLKKLKEFREELNQRLDQLERNSVSDIQGKYKPELEKLDTHINEIQKTKAGVLSAKNDLASANNNESQTFVSAKKGKNISENAVTYVAKTNGEIKEQEIHLKTDSKLSAMLEELDLLGQLTNASIRKDKTISVSEMETVPESPKVSSEKRSDKSASVKSMQNTNKTLITVKRKKQISIKIPTDKKECAIFSACVLENGTIILADFKNHKLKQVDGSTFTVTDYCEVPGSLHQVCAVSNQEVAVSLGYSSYIQFVSLRGKMVPTKQIKTNHPCLGLAYAAGHLYISDAYSVYIYTASGSKLQKFIVDHTGQKLLYSTNNLAVSDDGSKIYVANWKNGLIALDINGKDLGKFNGQEVKGVNHVCITGTGNMLVSGEDSKNIVQLTQDCKMIGKVMKCDSACQALCCDPRLSYIIIGYNKRDTIDMCDVN